MTVNSFIPSNYHLNLTINRHTETIDGEVTIIGTSSQPLIRLDAVAMKINQVTIDQTVCKDFSYDGKTLAVKLQERQIGTELRLAILFSATINHNMEGCYSSTYNYNGTERKIVTTQFESHFAREAFPCVDEPAAKASFTLNLRVSDLDSDDVVLANTPLVERDGNLFEFAPTPKMSTYLLAWVIGPFKSITAENKSGIKVTSYCALNQPSAALEFANETAVRALDYYEKRFNKPYPLAKLDQVALPDFEFGAMENWGLVTYRESMMLAGADATLDTKQTVALTVTHELSHQWFGNLVTMKWWDDLWLNESFASIMEYYCTDALYPDFDIWQHFYTGDCLAALRRDALAGVQAIRQEVKTPAEISTLFDGAIVYAKGARLVLMLMQLLGEDKFDQGLADYFDQFAYQNTTGDDLWRSLQPYADFDVRDFMHAWISQPGYPEIRDGKQHRFLLSGESDQSHWPLPEIFDDMSGHYLLNLSEAEFAAKLEGFANLSDQQKLRLLIDRMLLARTPEVEAASLLDLLPHFVDEDSAAVWDILLSIIGDLKLFCPPETKPYHHYQKYLNQLLTHHFDRINYQHLSDLNEIRIRSALVSVALYSKNNLVAGQLANLYNPDFSKVDAELRVAIFAAKMRKDEARVFSELTTAYKNSVDPELRADLLLCLASYAEDSAHLRALISWLERPDIVRPCDHIFLYIYLLRNFRTRGEVLIWLTSHWDYLKSFAGDSLEDYVKYAAGAIRTHPEADLFCDFFAPLKSEPILARTIAVSEGEIAARLNLISSDSPAVAKHLDELVNRSQNQPSQSQSPQANHSKRS